MANLQVVTDGPCSTVEVQRFEAGKSVIAQDILAEETPIALVYNGVSHAVMLATPQDLEDFALGFSLSEGIIASAQELYAVEVQRQANGIELHCEIASERFVQLKEKRRTLAGKTGCGLCGAENLAQAMRYPAPLEIAHSFSRQAIMRGLASMQAQQVLQQQTGATHASGYFSPQGEIRLLREDVGRHNALDKLVGAMAKTDVARDGFIITTSRASFEMVQKTASAGIGLLVAVSAPTGLAVRVANACNLTLVGFARGEKFVAYSQVERILND